MDTKEKIKQIKIRLGKTRKIKEDNVLNFGVKVQSYIDTIETIKLTVLEASQQGREYYTVIENIFSVYAPAFGHEAIIFANIPETALQKHAFAVKVGRGLAVAMDCGEDGDLFSITADKIIEESPTYDITRSYKYECACPSLLKGKLNPYDFDNVWYNIDTDAGKSVIKDRKLIELWELLEVNGLKPFFSGGDYSAHLCVHI
ncbi:hypothetical protein AADZ86_00845 [Colwelliaceae bacterium BS250]